MQQQQVRKVEGGSASSLLGQIQALSRTLVHDAHRQLGPAAEAAAAAEAASAPFPMLLGFEEAPHISAMKDEPVNAKESAGMNSALGAAAAPGAANGMGGRLAGDRLFLETEKLQLFTRLLQAVHDAAPANEPRSLAFAPSGMYLTVAVPHERRCHALSLPSFFFATYRCPGRGFRMVVDLQAFISALSKIYTTHRGRCVQLLDQPNNTLLVRSRPDTQKAQPAESAPQPAAATGPGVANVPPGPAVRTVRPSPPVSATEFEEGHVETGNDGRPWRVSVTRAGVFRWAPVHPQKEDKKKVAKTDEAKPSPQTLNLTVKRENMVARSVPETKAQIPAPTAPAPAAVGAPTPAAAADGGHGKRKKDDAPSASATAGGSKGRDEKLDDNKFFETVLIPIDPAALSAPFSTASNEAGVPGRSSASAGPRCERIPDRAYTRYPRLIEVGSEWMHNLFKRLQQHAKIGLEFDGEKRLLQFTSTLDGAPCREGDIISPAHILPNPFLILPANVIDTRTVVANRDVSTAAQDRPPACDVLPPASAALAADELKNFRYRADFTPAHIWKMVKPSKLCAHLHIYLAPDQPLLLQFVLQRDKDDSRRAATYSTWIAPIGRQPNPHVRMPAGGAAAVTRKMLELAPRLGSADQTFRVCTQAIQLAGGATAPSAPTPNQPAPGMQYNSAATQPKAQAQSKSKDEEDEEEDSDEDDDEQAEEPEVEDEQASDEEETQQSVGAAATAKRARLATPQTLPRPVPA